MRILLANCPAINKQIFIQLFFVVIGLNIVFAQDFTDTAYYNAFNQKVKDVDSYGFTRIISNDPDGSFQFLVRDYYIGGELKMKGLYKSINPDRKNGLFRFYNSNGNKIKECTYINNKLDGSYTTWYESGIIKQKSFYVNNKLDGIATLWDEKGNIKKKAEYKNGIKNGKFKTYYSNGSLIRNEIYKNGRRIKEKCFTLNGADTTFFNYYTPPDFNGGTISKFSKWLLEKVVYPVQEEYTRHSTKITVKFTVTKNGEIDNIEFINAPESKFTQEIVRVLRGSPEWKPAMHDFDSIDISVKIPISFK